MSSKSREKQPRVAGKILVVDDEPNARQTLSMLLEESHFEVRSASDGIKALGILRGEWHPDIVLTDLRMPLMDGFELIKKIKEANTPQDPPAIVVMTAFASVESAVEVMKQGADDYLTKPLNFDAVEMTLNRVMERVQMKRELEDLRQTLHASRAEKRRMIGSSPVMRDLHILIDQVAPARATVLVHGESGTGKELVARRLHERSNRADAPFVALHCGALPESLLESELFGHEKGAFTGAQSARKGRFEQADGGTLFLDEIGDISPTIQLKLLRVLQERRFERVGGNKTIEVDVRIVAATHHDLHKLVEEGKFREDLYYRLNVIRIETPPLRARKEDIPLLMQHLIARHARENDKHIEEVDPEVIRLLQAYSWPGNVRELENTLERAVVLATQNKILPSQLPLELLHQTSSSTPSSSASSNDENICVGGELHLPGATLEEIERVVILKTYEYCEGSSSKTADLLGVSQRKIQYKLKQYRAESPV